ncbi:hypothetical protein HQ529_02050 [Candidatus Woesearchaeota archaeon]|nr:hypothetical protein [Candidatus Woesearchaeota archaeon]
MVGTDFALLSQKERSRRKRQYAEDTAKTNALKSNGSGVDLRPGSSSVVGEQLNPTPNLESGIPSDVFNSEVFFPDHYALQEYILETTNDSEYVALENPTSVPIETGNYDSLRETFSPELNGEITINLSDDAFKLVLLYANDFKKFNSKSFNELSCLADTLYENITSKRLRTTVNNITYNHIEELMDVELLQENLNSDYNSRGFSTQYDALSDVLSSPDDYKLALFYIAGNMNKSMLLADPRKLEIAANKFYDNISVPKREKFTNEITSEVVQDLMEAGLIQPIESEEYIPSEEDENPVYDIQLGTFDEGSYVSDREQLSNWNRFTFEIAPHNIIIPKSALIGITLKKIANAEFGNTTKRDPLSLVEPLGGDPEHGYGSTKLDQHI